MTLLGHLRRTASSLLVAGFLSASFTAGVSAGQGILTTKHNLSKTGPGEIKALNEERVCIFCHTPHHASPVTPLWSRPENLKDTYRLYSSSTIVAKQGQPTGASRLCLSCHDGTIALGAFYPANVNVIEMVGGITTIPPSRTTNLGGPSGTDLTNDHPISFPYTIDLAQKNGQLKLPQELPPAIRLEQGETLQCTACHNPHRNPYGKFLVMDNAESKLCTSCHVKTGWETSGHATNGAIRVAGCGNCHVPHNGSRAERLLRNSAEEQNCLPCHRSGGSGGSGRDIDSQLLKTYSHRVSHYNGEHDEAENPLTATEQHVECEDCHNPHQVKSLSATAPNVTGSLLGVKGVASTGNVVIPSLYEYEICFRCHADNNITITLTTPIVRVLHELNTRLDFSTGNPSYHPVIGQGKGTNVPSLRPGYSTSSMIYCTDCHNSDDGVKAGGTAANGPHGSIHPYLMIARYETDIYSLTNPPPYLENYYALCYRCHDQNILLDPARSAFPRHQSHVRDRGILCSVCHDPHGVRGTTTANAHLINFDTRYVTSGTGYNSTARTCDVNCHSSAHPPY